MNWIVLTSTQGLDIGVSIGLLRQIDPTHFLPLHILAASSIRPVLIPEAAGVMNIAAEVNIH